ncbi:MAG: L,D-transpeptidase family protein [Actinomycetota bacterium]
MAGLAGPAAAAAATVSLSASKTDLQFGEVTRLTGTVNPPPPAGSTVEIVDASNPARVLATAATDASGNFAVDHAPEANVDAAARWTGDTSTPVPLRVHPRLTAQLENVRLFDAAAVSGRVEPPHPGGAVHVELLVGDRVVARENAPVGPGSEYSIELDVVRSGTYRARVSFDDADHEPAETTTPGRKVATPPPLHPGSNGDWVLALENRLDDLGYHVPRPNRNYDVRTGDAVLAFHKVQGMPRGKNATRRTWKRLADPRIPKPKLEAPSTHIEVNQSKQVLYVVRQGEVDVIVHASTGAGAATRDGTFRVHRKLAGFSPGHLYYPSYFDGLRAVHGWPDVPPSPASHGCTRVPMWTAKFLFRIMHYGMVVKIYH